MNRESIDTNPSAQPEIFKRGPCSFFLMGNCTRKNCKFYHSTTTGEEPGFRYATRQSPICTYFFMGSCKFGEKCRFSHGDEQTIQSPSLTKEGIDCGICYEKINKSFGILTCNCAFCLPCIRAWRSRGLEIQNKETVRLCPLCRQETLFVIPSPVFVTDKKKKEILLESYKYKCAQIPCKYFNPLDPDSSCPFGTSCFYAHLDEMGIPVSRELKASDEDTLQSSNSSYQRCTRRNLRLNQRNQRRILPPLHELEDLEIILTRLLASESIDFELIYELLDIVDEDESETFPDVFDTL